MLHLICGPSGSGKTKRLTEAIRQDVEAGISCLLLVPEQQVYTSERELPECLPSNAGLYLEILSFTGLSEKLFRRFGGLQFLSADRSVRTLVMWSVLRTLSPVLARYGRGGTVEESVTKLMQSAVEDLRINGITPQQLQAAAESLEEDDLLEKKLLDLAAISSLYSEKMKQLFGDRIPEERLLRLAKLLSEHTVFADTHIYVDSFTSFTWDENRVLLELMKQAKEMTVTLCTDELPSSLPHFKSVSDTGKYLKKLADEADILRDVTLLSRKDDGSDLSYLEQNLWRFDAKPYSKTATHVKALSARNLYEECEAAADEILALSEKGIRFGEIAVIVRDFETYRGWLDAALEKRSIPYFLSERKDFSQKPLARLVMSALRTVIHGYRTQDLFSLLKTGLSGVAFRDASLFEEYVETWHISGKRFLDDVWNMNPDGLTIESPSDRGREILETANRVKNALILPLIHLAAKLRASKTFSELCEALYAYILEIGLPETLANLSREELERGGLRDAQESVKLFGFLTDLLGKATTVLGEESLTTEEFLSALTILFSTADLGAVPLVNDCVVLGSASLLRVENVKATLLLGLCEGEFPGDAQRSGILSEADKERLSALDLQFRSAAEIKQSEELFYVYRAVTKPTEQIILLAPKSIAAGSEVPPSVAYLRICALLNLTPELYQKQRLRRTRPAPLSAKIPNKENEVTLSASGLEQFVSCPYRYHLTHTLSLRETTDALQGASESGNFLHCVFAEFLSREARDEETLKEIVGDYILKACAERPEKLSGQLLHQFSRLYAIAKAMLYGAPGEVNGGILGELKTSGFVPAEFEMPFRKEFDAQDGDHKLFLRGRIDRIDEKAEDQTTCFRVIDYKSAEHDFERADIAEGKEIQLVLYMMVLLEKHPEWIPAEGKYLWPEYKDDQNGKFTTKTDGLAFPPCTAAEFATYSDDLMGAVRKISKAIFGGEAQKTPSEDACKYCPAKQYCSKAVPAKNH